MKATTEKYYLYHIPGKKWGCTNNLERRLKSQKYKIEDLANLIIVGNLHKAANLEAELNKEYGYGWNISQDYRKAIKNASKGGKIGGLISGKINANNGHMNKIAKINSDKGHTSVMAKIAASKNRICPNCGLQGKGPVMYRFHFNNCKFA